MTTDDDTHELWQSALWWMQQLLLVFGAPGEIGASLRDRLRPRLLLWIAGLEALVRRLVTFEAMQLAVTPRPRSPHRCKKSPRQPDPADTTTWRVSFRYWRALPRPPGPHKPRLKNTPLCRRAWSRWRPDAGGAGGDMTSFRADRPARPEPSSRHIRRKTAKLSRAERYPFFGHAPVIPPRHGQPRPDLAHPAPGLARRIVALARVITRPAAAARRLAHRISRRAADAVARLGPARLAPRPPTWIDIIAAGVLLERPRPPDSG